MKHFISLLAVVTMITKAECEKQKRDSNCDTACKIGFTDDGGSYVNGKCRCHRDRPYNIIQKPTHIDSRELDTFGTQGSTAE